MKYLQKQKLSDKNLQVTNNYTYQLQKKLKNYK